MHKLVVMYPQPLDGQKFMDYYEGHHLPKVKDLPGLISAEYGRNDDPEASVFVMFTALFADKASMESALRSDVGVVLAKDIPNLSPDGVTMMSLPASQVFAAESNS
jgi:uncharacterized protein (TIGR02118 family)